MHNIIEDISRDYLDGMLLLRQDICTCAKCKEDILAYALSRIQPQYVTSDSGAMHTIIERSRVEYQAVIMKQLLMAIEIISAKPRHALPQDEDKAYNLLLEKIFEDRGVDFRHYRSPLLKRRIAVRMRMKKVQTYAAYLRALITDAKEYEELFEVLTINVSEFFRDPSLWDALRRQVYMPLIKEKIKSGNNRLVIWHAGIGNGEEPYSNAILICEILQQMRVQMAVKIVATDIDKDSLVTGRAGCYKKDSLANVSEQQLNQYFTAMDKGVYAVKKEIKQMVTFMQHNMITDAGFAGMDVVFCRNVFIYFMRSLQEQLIMTFHRALNANGYYVMGKVECLMGEAKTIFEEINSEEHIYKKIS